MVDKTLSGYVESNTTLREELKFWREAAATKDATIEQQAGQLHKLMAHSAVTTHALEDIMREARERGSQVGT
jgi:hypothetical protein